MAIQLRFPSLQRVPEIATEIGKDTRLGLKGR